MAQILIVDDEMCVLELVKQSLMRDGHSVLAAATVLAACDLADARGEPIDLLITDHRLPDGLGRQVAEYLQQQHPAMKVLHMSAYTLASMLAEGSLTPGAGFLAKPFLPKQLCSKVRDVLG